MFIMNPGCSYKHSVSQDHVWSYAQQLWLCDHFAVANLTVPSTCSIISTSLTILTTAGGAISSGTQNVIIYCVCMRNSEIISGPIRWLYSNGDPVPVQKHSQPSNPYYRNIVPAQLVFPLFGYPYNGTYRCAPTTDSFDVSSRIDTISLTLPGRYT